MKDLGPLSFMLGVCFNIDQEQGIVSLNQTAYLDAKFTLFGQQNSKSEAIPLQPGREFDERNKKSDFTKLGKIPYREAKTTTAQSTADAKYVAAGHLTMELTWI